MDALLACEPWLMCVYRLWQISQRTERPSWPRSANRRLWDDLLCRRALDSALRLNRRLYFPFRLLLWDTAAWSVRLWGFTACYWLLPSASMLATCLAAVCGGVVRSLRRYMCDLVPASEYAQLPESAFTFGSWWNIHLAKAMGWKSESLPGCSRIHLLSRCQS